MKHFQELCVISGEGREAEQPARKSRRQKHEKMIMEFVSSMFAERPAKKSDVADRAKNIEYLYVFSPRQSGPGFYAVCAG